MQYIGTLAAYRENSYNKDSYVAPKVELATQAGAKLYAVTEDQARFDTGTKKRITKKTAENSKRLEWTVVDDQEHYIALSEKDVAETRQKLAWRKGRAMIDVSTVDLFPLNHCLH